MQSVSMLHDKKASKQNNESYYGFGSRLYFAKGRKDFKMEKGKKYLFTLYPANKKNKQFALE